MSIHHMTKLYILIQFVEKSDQLMEVQFNQSMALVHQVDLNLGFTRFDHFMAIL